MADERKFFRGLKGLIITVEKIRRLSRASVQAVIEKNEAIKRRPEKRSRRVSSFKFVRLCWHGWRQSCARARGCSTVTSRWKSWNLNFHWLGSARLASPFLLFTAHRGSLGTHKRGTTFFPCSSFNSASARKTDKTGANVHSSHVHRYAMINCRVRRVIKLPANNSSTLHLFHYLASSDVSFTNNAFHRRSLLVPSSRIRSLSSQPFRERQALTFSFLLIFYLFISLYSDNLELLRTCIVHLATKQV